MWLYGPHKKEKLKKGLVSALAEHDHDDQWCLMVLQYLDRVKTLPRVKSRENFRGLRRSIGRKLTASPKQIVPAASLG